VPLKYLLFFLFFQTISCSSIWSTISSFFSSENNDPLALSSSQSDYVDDGFKVSTDEGTSRLKECRFDNNVEIVKQNIDSMQTFSKEFDDRMRETATGGSKVVEAIDDVVKEVIGEVIDHPDSWDDSRKYEIAESIVSEQWSSSSTDKDVTPDSSEIDSGGSSYDYTSALSAWDLEYNINDIINVNRTINFEEITKWKFSCSRIVRIYSKKSKCIKRLKKVKLISKSWKIRNCKCVKINL